MFYSSIALQGDLVAHIGAMGALERTLFIEKHESHRSTGFAAASK